MTAPSTGFELRGRDGDETRLLVGNVGYSLAVPGHPRVIAPPAEAPRYDVLVKLDDAAVEIGLRVEEVGPTTVNRDELAATLVTTYGQARAADPARAIGQHPGRRGRAAGSDAAARATYLLRDNDDVMEFVLVTLREPAALYLTARFRRSRVSVFGWGNLRSILLNHQSWIPGTLPALDVWPSSPRFLLPSVDFDLTPAAAEDARAKARDLGRIPRDKVNQLAAFLLEAPADDMPPTTPWAPFLTQHARARVAMYAGEVVADVLCRDLDGIESLHDYRGWAWGCYWAAGNRPGANEP